jgi:predicted nucleic acid-binding protein
VGEEGLLHKLYPGRLVLPSPVYTELSYDNPKIRVLRDRLDVMIHAKQFILKDIMIGTIEHELYYQLTVLPENNHTIIGRGEAAAIALAKTNGGIVASNNLSDVLAYTQEYKLSHITTGMILFEALHRQHITESEGNAMWVSMLKKRRKLGAATFFQYISQYFPSCF